MADQPWSQTQVSKLYQKIPLPISMTTSSRTLQFDFTSSAAAMTAFQILNQDGLQMQLLGTLLHQDLPATAPVPVPAAQGPVPVPPEVDVKYQQLEERLLKFEQNTVAMFQAISAKLGILDTSSSSTQPPLPPPLPPGEPPVPVSEQHQEDQNKRPGEDTVHKSKLPRTTTEDMQQ